jgi:hypothetical protein
MLPIVNLLGTLTALLCAFLLLRAYFRVGKRLLLWSGLCFVGLTISNGALLADLMLMPEISFYEVRLSMAGGSMLLLMYGLVFGSD